VLDQDQGENLAYSPVRTCGNYHAALCRCVTARRKKLTCLGGGRGNADYGAGLSGVGITRVKVPAESGGYYFIEMNTRLPCTTASLADPESIWRDAPIADLAVRAGKGYDRPVRSVTSTQTGQTVSSPQHRSGIARPTRQIPSPKAGSCPACGDEIYGWWNASDP